MVGLAAKEDTLLAVGEATDRGPVPPPVYFAGPVDYVEHRSPGDHRRDNWRHRFFGDLPIDLMCPTCMNLDPDGRTDAEIMQTNRMALDAARFFVGYFPTDSATFGTPIEVWEYCEEAAVHRPGTAVLVHPTRPGVFVRWLEAEAGLVVVTDFGHARQWLQRQLTQR